MEVLASLFLTIIWEKFQNLLKHMILCFLFIEATSHGEIEKKVDNLLKQMSVVSGQLEQLSDTVAKFVKCKFCQNKFYKSLDDNDVGHEDLATGRKKAEEYRATQATPPASTPTPVASSTPLTKKNENVISIQKSTDKNVDDSDVTILVGSASRGICLSKKKVDFFSRSSPKLFVLKLFELVFRREEAKEGSVEGKGEKLPQLDPNRLAAVREHTERMFPNEVNWPTVKKAIDKKCRMVRNNRCTLWAQIRENH